MEFEVQNKTRGKAKSQLTSKPNSHTAHAWKTQMWLKSSLQERFSFGVQPPHIQTSLEKKLMEKKTAKPGEKAIKFFADAKRRASEDKGLCR